MKASVLHVLDHSVPLHSGYAFRSQAIIEEQRAQGWATRQLTGPKQGACASASESVSGLTFERTPQPRFAGVPLLGHWALVRAIERRLDGLVRTEAPDVIHAHSPALNGLAALRVGRAYGIPVVYEVRAFWEDAAVDQGTTREGSWRYRLSRGLETWVMRRVAAVTCICDGLREAIVARGVVPERVTVVPNAVDAARFRYRPPRDAALADELGLSGCHVIGFVGSFYAYEGLDVALHALATIPNPGLRLLLVGGGPQAAALQALAQKLGVDDRVIFTGRVHPEEVPRYYSLLNALVYPRHAMRLTELVTPLKPLEAMAQGIPVIASDIGGHRELIRNTENGLLFPAGDSDALASAVRRLMADEVLAERLVQAGRDYVSAERTWAASVARYDEAYPPPRTAGFEVRS